MALLGITLLLASLVFICLLHPPLWLSSLFNPQKPSLTDGSPRLKPQLVVDATALIATNRDGELASGKRSAADLDRAAMPPPPVIVKRTIPSIQKQEFSTAGDPIITPTPKPWIPLDSVSGPSIAQLPGTIPSADTTTRLSAGLRLPKLASLPVSSKPRSTLLVPDRGPPAGGLSFASLAPPPTRSTKPTKPSRKVILSPGHSPLDWARLSSSPNSDLRGLPPSTPYLRVTPSMLKQQTGRKGKDAWTVLGSKVYNITPYLPYHPGGEPELLRGAGRDGTKLFGEVHPWVNYETMLTSCLLGIMVDEGDVVGDSVMDAVD